MAFVYAMLAERLTAWRVTCVVLDSSEIEFLFSVHSIRRRVVFCGRGSLVSSVQAADRPSECRCLSVLLLLLLLLFALVHFLDKTF